MNKGVRFGLGVASCLSIMYLTGCSAMRANTRVEEIQLDPGYARQAPGVVDYIWEEPMVDVIEVPPGLDPEGHYYRPAHHEVVEIRQGRWQYYKDDDSK